MKTLILYHSSTGFTRRYAQWIAEACQGDLASLEQAGSFSPEDYDAIVFGSWAHAGRIRHLSRFLTLLPDRPGQTRIVFSTGAMPAGSPEIDALLSSEFTEQQQKDIHRFYCPGGLNYEAMPVSSRVMMKLFARMVQSRKNKTEAEEEMARHIGSSYDLSDRTWIRPILDLLEAEPENTKDPG